MSRQLVVVVDDDRAIRDVLTEMLRSEGYAVEAIGDGPSAFQRIQTINDRSGPIAAITLDLSMPGKDGAAILRELKASPSTARVPVVIISASVSTLTQAARSLAASVIRKPFDVTYLLDTISSLVDKRPSTASPFPSAALANRVAKQ